MELSYRKIVLILFLVILGCSDLGEPEILEASLFTETDSLGFGVVTIGSAQSRSIMILNLGPGNLEATVALLNADPEFSLDSADAFNLNPGDTRQVIINFEPTAERSFSAQISILSNDPQLSELLIPVTGTGTPEPVPTLTLNETSLDFGTVVLGTDSSQFITISSVGTDTVLIHALTVIDTVFKIELPTLPLELAPGHSSDIKVSYAPVLSDSSASALVISSNTDSSPHQVTLTGIGRRRVLYTAEVQPIFNTSCVGCHGSNGKSGLNVSSYSNLMLGTSLHGPVVVPGDGSGSYLIRKLRADGVSLMPPGNSLPETSIRKIQDWIDQGALEN